MTQKFATGAFVFMCTRGLGPRDPTELQPLALQHDIPPGCIPTYAGDRVAITRAITQASRGLTKEGFLLRPISRTSTEIVYGIVQERKDESHRRLDHDFEATVSWCAEPDPSLVTGEHPVADLVRSAYQKLRGKVVADDWSSSVTSYLESHDAARMRGDGRVYWVPPQRLPNVRKLGAFLAEVGIDLILAEIEPEVAAIVQDTATTSLDDELARLSEEAANFDGTQKPSTYSRRLEEYQRLRQRAVLYRDAQGVGVETASRVLDELETKVSTMLDLRRRMVVHRDGTISTPDESFSGSVAGDLPSDKDATPLSGSVPGDPSTQKDEATGRPVNEPSGLVFAGARFTLTDTDGHALRFVSDDQAAKAIVAQLDAMGLAGTWQQAGTAELNIQNSGPSGAAVSLLLRLSRGRSLSDSAASLATWGIELAA
jgi:hypothetical protein